MFYTVHFQLFTRFFFFFCSIKKLFRAISFFLISNACLIILVGPAPLRRMHDKSLSGWSTDQIYFTAILDTIRTQQQMSDDDFLRDSVISERFR